MKRIKDKSLYLVTSEEYSGGRSTLEVAEKAIAGGIDILQMREKEKTSDELEKLGRELSLVCEKEDVIFIVNDDPRLAAKIDADGVHLGQEDLEKFSISETKDIIGDDKIIGVSTHSFEEFKKANSSACDYIAFGPIFPTKTKDYYIGTDDIQRVMRTANKPVVFIGGVNLINIDSIISKGGRNIAVIRSVVQAEDITSTVSMFRDIIERKI
jgi:thiamine-phosphate diphosphorylase